jgi:hypothetical protein
MHDYAFLKRHALALVVLAAGAAPVGHGWWQWKARRANERDRGQLYRDVIAAVGKGDDRGVIERATAFLRGQAGEEENTRRAQVGAFLDRAVLHRMTTLGQSGKKEEVASLLAAYRKTSATAPSISPATSK